MDFEGPFPAHLLEGPLSSSSPSGGNTFTVPPFTASNRPGISFPELLGVVYAVHTRHMDDLTLWIQFFVTGVAGVALIGGVFVVPAQLRHYKRFGRWKSWRQF